MWNSDLLETLWQDLRYSVRGLKKNLTFTAVTVSSLAFGISANSTIFSVLNAVLYRPLPYSESHRLMMLWETQQGHQTQPLISELVDWNKQNHVFDDIASTSFTESAPLGGGGLPAQIRVQYTTPNFFRVLRVQPLLGRTYSTEEIQDLTQTVVISDAFWKRRFGANPKALGTAIKVSGVISTIVGVMPPHFAPFYGDRIDLWIPINPAGDRYSKRDDRGWLFAIGRLKPGVTRAHAQAEMDVIARRLQEVYPDSNKDVGVEVQPLHEALFSESGQALLPLAGAVFFVLLIACANVANLLFSRTEARRKEYALRASLGAGRRRLIQQVLVESGLLAVLGGVLGVALTFEGIELFRILGGDFPNAEAIRVDRNVLLFTLAASVLTAIFCGSFSALLASRPDLNGVLREGDRRTVASGKGRIRQGLAIAEIALSVVLLVGAGLMIHSVLYLKRVNPGFDPTNVMTAEISLPEGGKYVDRVPGGSMEKTSALVTPFYQELIRDTASLPGAESSGIVSNLLGTDYRYFQILGGPPSPPENMPGAAYNEVSPSLFHALRIPLKRGRYLGERDLQGSSWTAVVNEAFARRYFPQQDPLGKRLLLRYRGYGVDEPQPREIVGVVGDVKHTGLTRTAPELIYASYLQQPAAFPGGTVMAHLRQILVIKMSSPVSGHEAELAATIKKIVMKLDPDQPVTEIMSMNRLLSTSIEDSRFYMRLLGIFAAAAVLLAGMGIYGVMSYFVRERTREIGIRMALGAERSSVVGMIAKLALRLALIGLAIGVVLALLLTRFVASLFSVSATDPATFGIVALALLATSMLACYLPARRAAAVDPMVTLRYE